MFDLDDRVALVTGGAGGIGGVLAVALARAGADVAVLDRDGADSHAVVAAVEAAGRASLFVQCDVTDQDQVDRAIDAVLSRFGKLDIAVNSAGVYSAGADADHSVADWRRVIDVNLTGTWLCSVAEFHAMTERGGSIINIASIAATRAISNGSYDASKAGVVQLSAALARQWGRHGVRVNSLSPGYVDQAFGYVRTEDERTRLRAVTPLDRVLTADDLAGPLIFLAADASGFVTGQNLIVDGGHTLSTWLRTD